MTACYCRQKRANSDGDGNDSALLRRPCIFFCCILIPVLFLWFPKMHSRILSRYRQPGIYSRGISITKASVYFGLYFVSSKIFFAGVFINSPGLTEGLLFIYFLTICQ